MYNDTLQHVGVKGMHWGKRMDSASRYKSIRKSGVSKEEARKKITTGNMNTGKSTVDGAAKITEESLKIHKSIGNIHSTRNKEDISTLTDAELKAKITRMNLEQQYSNLSANQITKGQSYAKSALEIGGSVLAIGSSAIGIAVAIKQLRGN